MILFCDYLNKQNFETTLDVNSFISFCFSSAHVEYQNYLEKFSNDLTFCVALQYDMKLFFYITKVYICN